MKINKIRELRADEIEVRPAQITEKGISLLLYKDARVDQKILDETFGTFGWQRTHQMIGDRLYCTIEIWDEENKQWIKKQDVGTESNTEKEKGQASDSFKRAGFNVGIGRELYTAPFVWVPAEKTKIDNKNGKFTTYDKFSVDTIEYTDGEITKLLIKNDRTDLVVSSYNAKSTKPATSLGLDFGALEIKYKNMTIDELRKEYVGVATYQGWSKAQKTRVLEMIKKIQESKK